MASETLYLARLSDDHIAVFVFDGKQEDQLDQVAEAEGGEFLHCGDIKRFWVEQMQTLGIIEFPSIVFEIRAIVAFESLVREFVAMSYTVVAM